MTGKLIALKWTGAILNCDSGLLSLSVSLSSISSPVISGAKLINSLIFHVEVTES